MFNSHDWCGTTKVTVSLQRPLEILFFSQFNLLFIYFIAYVVGFTFQIYETFAPPFQMFLLLKNSDVFCL